MQIYVHQHKLHYELAERCKYTYINISCTMNWQRNANIRTSTHVALWTGREVEIYLHRHKVHCELAERCKYKCKNI